jgi:putative protease
MIEHLPALIDAGIRSFKIEGRMKSVHYLAGVVKVYREAIDDWYRDPQAFRVQEHWLTELAAISHRGYCTGFYFGDPDQTAANLDNLVLPGYRFVAQVIGPAAHGGVKVLVKNKIVVGERVDVLSPGVAARRDVIRKITDEYGISQPIAQPGAEAIVHLDEPPDRLDLIRRPEEEEETKGP